MREVIESLQKWDYRDDDWKDKIDAYALCSTEADLRARAPSQAEAPALPVLRSAHVPARIPGHTEPPEPADAPQRRGVESVGRDTPAPSDARRHMAGRPGAPAPGSHLGSVRRDAWGPISLALNPFKNICRELSVLYDAEPADDARPDRGPRHRAGALSRWPLADDAARAGVYALGLNECFVRPHVDERGRFSFRMVTPDFVRAYATMDDPRNPVALLEYRLRRLPATEPGDRVRSGGPSITTTSATPRRRSTPCTPQTTTGPWARTCRRTTSRPSSNPDGNFIGDAYPFRRTSGRPFIPYQLYHSSGGGGTCSRPYDGQELVEASLDLSVLHQMVVHTFRDASWPQRYVVNVEPVWDLGRRDHRRRTGRGRHGSRRRCSSSQSPRRRRPWASR
jgi:hypothetical protein